VEPRTGYFLAVGAGTAAFYLGSTLTGPAAGATKAAGATLALWGAWKLAQGFTSSGGLAAAVGDAILGEPDRAELDPVDYGDTFAVNDSPALGPFLGGSFLEPLNGAVVNRTANFGSEYLVRIELRNRSMFERRVELSVETVEDDIRPAPPVPQSLGLVTLPGRRGLVVTGRLKLATRMILTGRVNVTAKLLANGLQLDRTSFEVA